MGDYVIAELGQLAGVQQPGACETQPLSPLASHTVALVLNNNKMAKMKNYLFSGLGLLERTLWSLLPLEATLVCVVCSPKLC